MRMRKAKDGDDTRQRESVKELKLRMWRIRKERREAER